MNTALPENYEELDKKARKFGNKNLRKIFYEMAIKEKEKGNLVKSAKIILLGWNWRAYADINLDEDEPKAIEGEYDYLNDDMLTEQLESVLNNHRELIDKADNSKLSEFDLEEHKQVIEDVFNDFCNLTRIGSTAAGKVMHIMAPTTFMMWDSSITTEYHKEGHKKEGSSRAPHSKGSGEYYWQFLKETQKFINSLDKEVKNPVRKMDQYNMTEHAD